MKQFWDFLLIDSLPKDSLENLNFTIFGFGDSSYEKYNFMARKLYQRLLQLGAKSFVTRGLGDDSKEGGYIVDLIQWKTNLFKALAGFFKNFAKMKKNVNSLSRAPRPTHNVKLLGPGTQKKGDGLVSFLGRVDRNREASEIFEGALASKKRMTADDHFQDVEEIVIDSGAAQKGERVYKPGDVAVVFPKNSKENVDYLLNYFGLDEERLLEIKSLSSKVVYTVSAEELFGYVLPISQPPRFFFFKLFAFYTKEKLFADKIKNMGKFLLFMVIFSFSFFSVFLIFTRVYFFLEYNEYYDYAIKQRRTVPEILFDFKSVKIPLPIFISFLGFQKPREYSISSSYEQDHKKLGLTVAIVDYKTNLESKDSKIFFKN